MIRPTMSHALNKEDLLELMSKYASYLEGQLAKANERVKELEAEKEAAKRVCKERYSMFKRYEQLRKEQEND